MTDAAGASAAGGTRGEPCSGTAPALELLGPRELDPPYDDPRYRSTTWRAPSGPLVVVPDSLRGREGPVFSGERTTAGDADLTAQHAGEPVGERIVVTGRLVDGEGKPIAGQLVELWQANAAGRYAHADDRHRAPLDPNFTGYGRCLTGPDGTYRFVTIRPGAYPWDNHPNAWRPAHLHFSLFGRAFGERIATQMYFPGDPLLALDPIYQSVRDPSSRSRLVATFDLEITEPGRALGYRHDLVVGGRSATPPDPGRQP